MAANVARHQLVKNADLLVQVIESGIKVFEVRMQPFKVSLTAGAISLDCSTHSASCFHKYGDAPRNVELLQGRKRVWENNAS